MYKIGGRKFGFLSVGPLGCIPLQRALDTGSNGSCSGKVTSVLKLHNTALSKALQELESQLKGFKYSYHNLYSSLSERIDNPSKYGMSNIFLAIINYIFWVYLSGQKHFLLDY